MERQYYYKSLSTNYRLVIIFLLLCISIKGYSQTYQFFSTRNYHTQLRLNTKTGEVYQIQDDGQSWLVHSESTPNGENIYRYSLYPTRNMWTFILLDRFTGKLWQCQFSVEGDNYIFSVSINESPLSSTYSAKFSIQATMSIYQFYLTNEETGELYQFQWSTKDEAGYRWIKKIH